MGGTRDAASVGEASQPVRGIHGIVSEDAGQMILLLRKHVEREDAALAEYGVGAGLLADADQHQQGVQRDGADSVGCHAAQLLAQGCR